METHELLEREFANIHLKGEYSPEQCVAVSSGTSALHIAFETLQRKNSAALIPEFTMVACARAATMAGFDVIPVDCNDNLLITPLTVSPRITERASVLMPVHIYGRLCNMEALSLMAEQFDLDVIEDMAEVHGCRPHRDSYAACWSFYKNKIIHGEEGGMIVFRDKSKATLARMIRSQGFTPEHNFIHIPRGVNARMSNIHAKLIRTSLYVFKYSMLYRNRIVELYDDLIDPKFHMPPRVSPWVYDLRIPGMTEVQQDLLVQRLCREGIAARHAFKPLSIQPEYRLCCPRYPSDHVLNALNLSREIIYLPVSDTMSESDVDLTCALFDQIVKEIF
jgi:perosamine synthetase